MALGAITWEAILRFYQPSPVAGPTVMIVAGIGIIINGLTAYLFQSGQKSDINIRGAYLHMIADAAVSFGVVLAGGLLYVTGWNWIDPLVSLVIVAVIFGGTWGLLKELFNLSIDAVPSHISVNSIQEYLHSLAYVVEVHDLHIWAISSTDVALTVHLTVSNEFNQYNKALQVIEKELHDRFDITHITVQFENEGFICHSRNHCNK